METQHIVEESHWYAVRTVYLWGQKSNGVNVFEERIVAFKTTSDAEVFAKAAKEADEYAVQDDYSYEIHPQQTLYRLDDGDLIDGHEIWSQLFEADMSLRDFYQNRYASYKYAPE